MAQIDLFANQLLEEAKRFLERAGESTDAAAKSANRHAALMLAFCALEAHVNAIGEEFSRSAGLSAHERGVLLEKEVKLEDGEFVVTTGLRMTRLEDRIEFLHTKFSGKKVDRSSTSWRGQLSAAINLRNRLTHVREVPTINEADVERALEAVIATLTALYKAIYHSKFHPASRGLGSKLSF
jgi:hypothetical protein